ncbi:ankyrin [Streptomyces sp. AS58]|uniref:hypothetical protein n=1 Tax=Streptomyces sp. AS58 TaxID=1519489 RepID=UPI0006AE2438|nr:hypothetical protein [Streptomyces sp. AS58]KOV73580.1 ankyrin [Streptomyces sp. AS58]
MPRRAVVCHDPWVSAALYESHVTVRCTDADEWLRLHRWAAAAGLKLTHIVLVRGRLRDQPMLTLSGSSSYAEQAARARDVVTGLRTDGFDPVRVKTECTPWAPEVPARLGRNDERYFEHHVKLMLNAGTDLAALGALVVPYGAHLSWNARRVRAGTRHERFVTQRCREVGAHGAGQALERLLTELAGFVMLNVEREFVLHDSDLSLDDGWIEDPVEVRT